MKNNGIIKFCDFCKSIESFKDLKIGVIGGTFNPVHWGHIQCAQIAADKLNLNYVLFMPANIPNFKQNQQIAKADDRLLMCQLAIEQSCDSRLYVCDYEVFAKGVSYTSDTLKHVYEQLKKHCDNFQIFFISGSDVLSGIKSWHNYKEIFKYSKFVAISRRGQEVDNDKLCKVTDELNNNVIYVQADAIEASSQQIRKLAHEYTTNSSDILLNEMYELCPKNVVDYYISNNLY